MKNTFGQSVSVTLFGESHGSAIGAVLDGLMPGCPVDEGFISEQLTKRRPAGKISTQRVEADQFKILSGVYNGYTTGTPIAIEIPNTNTRSGDYSDVSRLARPGHADYTAHVKYKGFEDFRGGGHFSGRLTAALVAAGAIAISALKDRGIELATHIKSVADVSDREFSNLTEDIKKLNGINFAVLDDEAAERMIKRIEEAAKDGDSVGGVLETAITGLPAGIGEPFFDSVESQLSHMMFSVPGVKGIEFGAGFEITKMRGSRANDPIRIENGRVMTLTNNNGGINGGITNGMPIIFRLAIKPTPSIFKTQDTIDYLKMENAELSLKGRHDPAIIHRARVVVDSLAAIAICDMLATSFGTDWRA